MSLTDRSKGTILLLCSDSDISAVLRDMLEGAEYLVLPAIDLGSAVDRLSEATPDLLIVRPHLEIISGHQAALYLRTKCNGLRVLMVGGLPDDDRITYRESLQAVEIFPKPFTAAEFLEKIASVLAPAPTNRT
jgi:DNA-binding response OmpR family regulator